MSPGFERYSVGWTDPRGVFGSAEKWTHRRPYGAEFKERGLPLMKRKVNTYKYTTEAKDLPIEVCRSMWIIKYGDGPLDAKELVEQDALIWEIGNRLWWAGMLEHDTQMDTYTCKS